MFVDHFHSAGLTYELNNFSTVGGSDYFPFITLGEIPAGSIATGAGAVKSAEQRALFGGVANSLLDPCYHKRCDTVDNINKQGLVEMTAAAASVVIQVVNTKDPLG